MRAASVKRSIDVVISLVLIIALAIPMIVIAGAVLAFLGRPILFCQPRVGRGGEVFVLKKFRSMRSGDEPDEQRMSKFGRWLRSTSLDELPELVQVLRGKMSLVGPRPLLVEYLPRYSAEQARRHTVRPGLTGLAQVSGRNTLGWAPRFALDVWYVDNWTVWGDVKILGKTLLRLIRPNGISETGEATMSPFTGEAPVAGGGESDPK